MQGRGEHIVKLVQIFGGHQFACIKQAWELLEFGHGFGLHAAQKHARVNLSVKTFSNGFAAGCKV